MDGWYSCFAWTLNPLPFLITGNAIFWPKSINEVYKVKMLRWADQLLAQSCFNLTRALSKQRWHGRLDSPQVHTPERCLSIQNITLNADTRHPKITRRVIKVNTYNTPDQRNQKHCAGSWIQFSRTIGKSKEMWHIWMDILRAVSHDLKFICKCVKMLQKLTPDQKLLHGCKRTRMEGGSNCYLLTINERPIIQQTGTEGKC